MSSSSGPLPFRMSAAFCCLFVHEGATLVVGTGTGELLLWDVARFWVWSSASPPHHRHLSALADAGLLEQ